MNRSFRCAYISFVLTAALGFLLPASATACAVPIDRFDPAKSPSDAIARAVAIDRTGEFFDARFAIRIVDPVVGQPPSNLISIKYSDYIFGTCGTTQPLPDAGDDLVVYFSRGADGSLALKGWQINPYTAAALEKRNKIANLWRDRRSKYFIVNPGADRSWSIRRALAINDPKGWISLKDPAIASYVREYMIGIGNDEEFLPYINIEFDVSDDGRMTNCKASIPDAPDGLASEVCRLVTQRARLVPPVFPEERKGDFSWRPLFRDARVGDPAKP